MKPQPNKRILLIIVSAVDVFLSGIVLLIYFGFLPVDISSLNVPHWVVGLIGGLWFVSALIVLVYQVTKTETIE